VRAIFETEGGGEVEGVLGRRVSKRIRRIFGKLSGMLCLAAVLTLVEVLQEVRDEQHRHHTEIDLSQHALRLRLVILDLLGALVGGIVVVKGLIRVISDAVVRCVSIFPIVLGDVGFDGMQGSHYGFCTVLFWK